MKVLDNGSYYQSADRAKYSCSEQEHTNGNTFVPYINSSLYHGDRRWHPAFSTQVPHEEPKHAEWKTEGEEEAKAVRYDTQ